MSKKKLRVHRLTDEPTSTKPEEIDPTRLIHPGKRVMVRGILSPVMVVIGARGGVVHTMWFDVSQRLCKGQFRAGILGIVPDKLEPEQPPEVHLADSDIHGPQNV